MFSNHITNYRYEKNLTQQELADMLSNRFKSMTKLDAVTLSRWENNKTRPPLKKQFQVLDYLNSLIKFINNYPQQEFDYKSNISIYLSNKFENSITMLSEITNSDNINYKLSKNNSIVDTNHLFKKYFHDNNTEEKLLKNHTKTISWIKNNQTYACLIYTDKIDSVNNYYNDAVVFTGIFAKTQESFESLFIFLYDYISSIKKQNIIIYSFDENDYKLFKNLRGELVKSIRISKNIIKSVFKFNRIDFLAHKDLFNYYKSIK